MTDVALKIRDNLEARSVFFTCLSALLFSTSFYEIDFLPSYFRYVNYFCFAPFLVAIMDLKKLNNSKTKWVHFSILVLLFTLSLEIISFTWVYASIQYFFHLNLIFSLILYLLICLLSFPYYFILFLPIFIVVTNSEKYQFRILDIFLLSIVIISIEHFYPRLAMWFFGYSYFYDSHLRLIASYFGSFGLSFIFFYSNILFAFYYEKISSFRNLFYNKYFINIILLLIFIFSISALMKLAAEDNQNNININVAYIQPNFSAIQGKDIGGKFLDNSSLEELMQKINDKNFDFIVIPESSIYYQYGSYPEKMEDILSLAKKVKKPILVQAVLKITNKQDKLNSLTKAESNSFIVFPNEQISNTYAKWNLMPFGEELPFSKYLPYLGEMYLNLTGQKIEIIHGNEATPIVFNSYKIGVFICYDSINVNLVHSLAKNGADFLINQANFYWMIKTNAIFVYSVVNQFKAIESGKSMLFSTNNGPTILFDKNGSKLFNNNLILSQDARILKIPIYKNITFYTKYMNEIKLFILLIDVLLFFYFIRRRL